MNIQVIKDFNLFPTISVEYVFNSVLHKDNAMISFAEKLTCYMMKTILIFWTKYSWLLL